MSNLYKERMNLYHDRNIEKIECQVGDFVLLFNFKLYLAKMKLKWFGPFKVIHIFSARVVKI